MLSGAAWAPSNLQPWHIYVLTGRPLAVGRACRERLAEATRTSRSTSRPATEVPYRERRSAFGEQRYGALGIPREDIEARQRAASANWDCFGAPAALFCYIDRGLGPAQWSDTGMYLQTVMLLLRAEGLHSCTQMAWAKIPKTVAEVLSPPDELLLFCGMSIGFEDVTVGDTRTGGAARRDGHVRRRVAAARPSSAGRGAVSGRAHTVVHMPYFAHVLDEGVS